MLYFLSSSSWVNGAGLVGNGVSFPESMQVQEFKLRWSRKSVVS
jgi:hypothetical protein